jgi:ABC-type sugar transport system permease subunit
MSNAEQLIRPPKVATSVKLLYTALGIEIIRIIIGAFKGSMKSGRLEDAQAFSFVLFCMFCIIIIKGILINMISIGRNWARITFLVLFILGSLAVVRMFQSLKHDPFYSVLGLVIFVLQAIALVFLLQADSASWFNSIKYLKDGNTQSDIQPDH